jgi:hypothetical protein
MVGNYKGDKSHLMEVSHIYLNHHNYFTKWIEVEPIFRVNEVLIIQFLE